MALNFLLDSAEEEIWGESFPNGIFNGITTNPSLLQSANQPCQINNLFRLAKKARQLGCKQLHIQSWGKESKEIFERGMKINELSSCDMRIYVKVPLTEAGIFAAKKLVTRNIPITFTACYEVKQVLVAAAIGASYVAPYLGRINDLNKNGVKEVIQMQQVLEGIGSSCKLLVASIRKPQEICDLSLSGIDTFTINYKLTKDIINVKETVLASDKFEEAAKGN